MAETTHSRSFHCADCEVGWIAGPACFCCGRAGTTGNLSPTIVQPARSEGWSGPLSRPAAYRTTAGRIRAPGGMSV